MRHLGRIARTRLLIGASAAAILCTSGAALAQDKPPITIAPQPLAAALYEFGGKTGTQVIFPSNLATAKQSGGVAGESDERLALTQLLAGTGLSFRREGDVFVILQQEGGSSPQAASADDGSAVEALIVTAQKKEEAIQDVPIAISAFTQKSLDAQKIEGGFDLLKAIPNVTFSKSNFSGYNFSIRGIGTKAVSATTDPGVAVAFNNSTLIVNRLFEQEYFDVERVEVLRGPQGTLYGRNATGGVINVISARPRLGEFEGDLKIEAGNYNAQRVRGMVNIPVGDTLAIRAAGALTKRDGYGINLAASDPAVLNDLSEDVDGRDLWSARVTVGWEPIEQIRVNALWERFQEDDNRVRTSKQLCHRDPGPNDYDTFDWDTVDPGNPLYTMSRAQTSQGCQATSLYAPESLGTPNGASLPYVGGLFWGSVYGDAYGSNTDQGLGGNPYYDHPAIPGPPTLTAECGANARFAWFSPLDLCRPDPYGGQMQSSNLREIRSLIEPIYRAEADVFELSVDIDLTDSLTFTSQTVYVTDEYYASQDYNRFTTYPIFNDSSLACSGFAAGTTYLFTSCPGVHLPTAERPSGHFNLTPGGYFNDPQLGLSNTLVAQDLSQSKSDQFNQEFRLASNFDAPFNFSLGANFTRFETLNDYYVFLNAASLITNFFPLNKYGGCHATRSAIGAEPCVYVDPNPLESINGEGHNYFRSANPYELTSSALFGEVYWQATDTLKVTLGARMTWDRKVFTPIPSQLLLYDYRQVGDAFVPEGAGPETCVALEFCQLAGTGIGGRGSPAEPEIRQDWREPTGRVIVDWKPDLGFTDETMVYASIAHGYKGGGANPPKIGGPAGLLAARSSGGAAPATFEAEFVDAFELGTKNTLLGGALILNGSAFYYDYSGYQVSKIVDRSAANENFDTTVAGVELEWIFSPTRNLRFNGTFGHLRTEIADGETSIDLMDRADGGRRQLGLYDEWVVLKPWLTSSSNCVAPKVLVEMLLLANEPTRLNQLCPGGNVVGFTTAHPSFPLPDGRYYDPTAEGPLGGAGFAKDIGGNELPNAPHWTASFGAQYRMALPGGWDATLRGDFYWQSQSYARVYNTQYDKLRAWTNANISLWFEQPDWGVTAEVYVKNAFDEIPITDAFLNSDDSGLTTNIFTLDPRLVGVSVRKSF